MIQKNCRFCKGRDIISVVPCNSPNITELIEKDAIQDKSVPALFNEISSFEDIGFRVRNRFDILEYQSSVVRIRGARKNSAE